MKLKDKRIIDFLEKKLIGKNIDIEKFLEPSENDFRDPMKLKNVPEAVEKISKAINENKKILIYGDYDSDGICASTILYLFFKSKGANANVFIPNRFENGYGISIDAIEEIESCYNPDLIVTVDLGITAVEEVEILKQEGIDIVITDHHIPLDEIPDCLVVDPKIESDYGFDALCGAGVALKLVEAMAGREEAKKYLDIAAIATVGDIVPLVDENRAIAKLGIEKINRGDCLKSISFMLKKLELASINSTDISFKIVPRLNACGRMDNALKVFDFLIQTDEKLLEEKYAEIEYDNTVRLSFIDKGNKIIEKQLKNLKGDEYILFLKGEFHEGVIGILASRVVHEFNKPAIIFTKTEDGTLKGSGRSIEGIDLHEIVASLSDSLVNFGGHKMAIGVEIEEDMFENFKQILNEKIKEKFSKNNYIINDKNFDIEITDDDLTDEFFKQISLLEPFGCENEKPVLAIRQRKINPQRVSEKVFKHYRLFTEKNNQILGFNYYKFLPLIESNSEKLFFVELSENTFHGKTSLSVTAKGISVVKPDFAGTQNDDFMSSLFNLYYSIFDFNNMEKYHVEPDLESVIKSKFGDSEFGTLVVCSSEEDLQVLDKLNLSKYYSAETYRNGQNTILISPAGQYSLDGLDSYKNIIFMHKYFENEHLFYSQKFDVYESDKISKMPVILSKDREVFVRCYKLINNYSSIKANDEIDFAKRLAFRDETLSECQLLFCLIVFMELNFFEFDKLTGSLTVLKAKKMELSNSKMYMEVD
jgi:single-stranded-DNA-specific exonuclease